MVVATADDQPELVFHPLPGPDKLVLRQSKCCGHMLLVVYASKYQTYAECQTCSCRCMNPGEDDGQITCWTHHDCQRGDCTHGE